VVSDFNKILYSTSAKDVEAKKAYMAKGMSLPEAIHAILRERNQV